MSIAVQKLADHIHHHKLLPGKACKMCLEHAMVISEAEGHPEVLKCPWCKWTTADAPQVAIA